MMDVQDLEESGSDLKEPECLFNEEKQPSNGVQVQLSRGDWGVKGGEDMLDKLLYPFCTAEGSIDQDIHNSLMEYWMCSDNQQNTADCPVGRNTCPSAAPDTLMPCPIIPVLGSIDNPMIPSPTMDTCTSIASMCSPTGSAWDTLRSTSWSPGSSDHVGAAAHLHLLGESLSLIGQLLQETNKIVNVPTSLSLLMDSLLCAVVPLVSLTSQIPELRNCTHRTLAPALENIAYLMPGL